MANNKKLEEQLTDEIYTVIRNPHVNARRTIAKDELIKKEITNAKKKYHNFVNNQDENKSQSLAVKVLKQEHKLLKQCSSLQYEDMLSSYLRVFDVIDEVDLDQIPEFIDNVSEFINVVRYFDTKRLLRDIPKLSQIDTVHDSINLLDQVGKILISKDKLSEGLGYLNRAIEISPGEELNRTTNYYLSMIEVYMTLNDIIEKDSVKYETGSDFVSRLPTLIESSKSHSGSSAMLADLYAFVGNFEKAKESITDKGKVREKMLAHLDLLNNNPNKAINFYTKMLEEGTYPEGKEIFKLNLAIAQYVAGEHEGIRQFIDKPLPNKEDLIKVNYLIGELLVEENNIKEAKKYFHKATKEFLSINPKRNAFDLIFDTWNQRTKFALMAEEKLNKFTRENNHSVRTRINEDKLMPKSRIDEVVSGKANYGLFKIRQFSIYLVPTQERLREYVTDIDSQNPVDVAVFQRGFPGGMHAGLYAAKFSNKGIPINRVIIQSDLDQNEIEKYFQDSNITLVQYNGNNLDTEECLIGIESQKVYAAINEISDVEIIKQK